MSGIAVSIHSTFWNTPFTKTLLRCHTRLIPIRATRAGPVGREVGGAVGAGGAYGARLTVGAREAGGALARCLEHRAGRRTGVRRTPRARRRARQRLVRARQAGNTRAPVGPREAGAAHADGRTGRALRVRRTRHADPRARVRREGREERRGGQREVAVGEVVVPDVEFRELPAGRHCCVLIDAKCTTTNPTRCNQSYILINNYSNRVYSRSIPSTHHNPSCIWRNCSGILVSTDFACAVKCCASDARYMSMHKICIA